MVQLPVSDTHTHRDLNSTVTYTNSLCDNNTILVDLAAAQLPQFGVDPRSIRSAFLNSSSVSSQTLQINISNGYLAAVGTEIQLIRVQYTVVTMVRNNSVFPFLTNNLVVDPRRDLTMLF